MKKCNVSALLGFFLLSIFTSIPVLAKENQCKKIYVISDMNGGYCTSGYSSYVRTVVQYIQQNPPDLVVTTGDHVGFGIQNDSTKQYKERCLQYQGIKSHTAKLKGETNNEHLERARRVAWKKFKEQVAEPISAVAPLCMTPGNHDAGAVYKRDTNAYIEALGVGADENNADNCFYSEKAKQSGIEIVDMGDHPLYYSFMMDNALFTVLNNEARDQNISQKQLDWLSSLYKNYELLFPNINRKFILSHYPLYPVGSHRTKSGYLRDKNLNQIIRNHCVDASLSGHHNIFYPGLLDHKYLLANSPLSSIIDRSCSYQKIKIISNPTISGRGKYFHEHKKSTGKKNDKQSPKGMTIIDVCKNGDLSIQGVSWKEDTPVMILKDQLPKSLGSGELLLDPDFNKP